MRGAELLLARRAPDRAWYPGAWDLVGGHCEPGESAADTLQRELAEEIGVRPTVFEELQVIEEPGLRYHVFVVRAWTGELRLANDEHTELRWLDLERASTLPLADARYLELFRRVLGR